MKRRLRPELSESEAAAHLDAMIRLSASAVVASFVERLHAFAQAFREKPVASVKYQIRFISRFLLTSSLERANEPAYLVVGTLTDAREQDVIDSGWIADDEVTESVGGESGYSSVRRHGNDGSKSIG